MASGQGLQGLVFGRLNLIATVARLSLLVGNVQNKRPTTDCVHCLMASSISLQFSHFNNHVVNKYGKCVAAVCR